jgi:hypothetical protein
MHSNDEKTDMILIYGEFNKNAKNSSFFSQFHLTKGMAFMSKFTKLHS